MSEKRILTEEEKKKLQGFLPFNSKTTTDFTPELLEGLDKELVPKFSIRSLTNQEQNQIKTNLSKFYSDIKDKNEDEQRELVKSLANKTEDVIYKCILGFSNFYDVGTGEQIVFVKESNESYISKDLYLMIPEWLRAEIVSYVRKISCLSTPEKLSLK